MTFFRSAISAFIGKLLVTLYSVYPDSYFAVVRDFSHSGHVMLINCKYFLINFLWNQKGNSNGWLISFLFLSWSKLNPAAGGKK